MSKKQKTVTTKGPHGVKFVSLAEPPEQPANPTYPWPRAPRDYGKTLNGCRRAEWQIPNKKEFALSEECLKRPIEDKWDQYDTHYYNEWIKIKVKPSRLLCIDTLHTLGIHDEVMECLNTLGLRHMTTSISKTYPDLVHQFLATIRYEDEIISFMALGVRYRVPLDHFSRIYGFANTAGLPKIWPIQFKKVRDMWNAIGDGKWDGEGTKQAMIRHPVLRYVIRVISSTIFCRQDASKVRKNDMSLLYFCIGDRLSGVDGPSMVNMAHVFANHLLSLKTRPWTGGNISRKIEYVGSYLTPLFQHCGIPVHHEATRLNSTQYFDLEHLHATRFIVQPCTYVFTQDAQTFHMHLPKPDLTAIDTEEKLLFRPPRELIMAVSSVSGHAASSSNAAGIEDVFAGIDVTNLEPLIPPQYAVSPDPDYRIQEECNRWMVAETKKNRNFIGSILRAITCIGKKSDAIDPPSTSTHAHEDDDDMEEE